MTFDLIALGETMLVLAPPPGENIASAQALVVDHGGAESNSCVGLARLGFRVAWVSRLGTDPAGDRILEALRDEGVDSAWVRRDPDRPTGLMLIDPTSGARYYRAGSAASQLSRTDLDGVRLDEAGAVLVTGVTALIGPDPQAAAIAFLERAKGLRVVDPNLRDGLWGSGQRAQLVVPLIERSDLLLGGEEELREIVGGSDARDVAGRCAARGPREVVVRSEKSVASLDGDGRWVELAVERHPATDPIGAGDAFNAGYLAARLRGGAVDQAIAAGVRCGTAVAGTPGATSGFPRSLNDLPVAPGPPRLH